MVAYPASAYPTSCASMIKSHMRASTALEPAELYARTTNSNLVVMNVKRRRVRHASMAGLEEGGAGSAPTKRRYRLIRM